jgi:hypothetical protein
LTKSELEAGDINTGIAIVVPFARISETIKGIDLADDETVTKLHSESIQNSGAKSASRNISSFSSSDDVPPTSDANPAHRGDFNGLLDAGAKKRPTDDST